MRPLALVLALAACESQPTADNGKPAYAPRPTPVVTPDAAPPLDAPPAPPPPTLSDVFRSIANAGDVPRVCFAVSNNRRRAACALGSWSNQTGNTLTITILGDVGDAKSEWTYHQVEGMNNGPERGGTPERLTAPAELDAAHQALRERGYRLAADPQVLLLNNQTITFGGWTLRRARVMTRKAQVWKPGDPPIGGDWNEYEEHVELRCSNDRWVPIGIADVRYDEPLIWLSRLNERTLLVTLDSLWGIEGEYGGARDALALDPAALCKAL